MKQELGEGEEEGISRFNRFLQIFVNSKVQANCCNTMRMRCCFLMRITLLSQSVDVIPTCRANGLLASSQELQVVEIGGYKVQP